MFFFAKKKRIQELTEERERILAKVEALEAQNNRLQTLLESMVEGMIALDADTRILSINTSVEKIFGIKKKEAQGKFFLEAIPNNDIAEVIQNVLEESKFVSCELSLVWPVQKIFQINASPILQNGTVRGCLIVIHDITEIRNLERVRSDFVANVSHEIKTPLTSIKGFVETLLEGALEDKENSRHFLQIIRDHADRLDVLVNDLLDLAYLESQEAAIEKVSVNLKGLADEVLAGFTSQLNRKAIEAKNDLSGDLIVQADKDKMGQVFTNLIDNAIKFNRHSGSIRIYAEDIKDGIKITVEDSGAGIPPKDIPRIFERFYRVDKARSRELGGTGLGLSIVKHIVELHGGRVGVESTEGLGSQFWFTLPK